MKAGVCALDSSAWGAKDVGAFLLWGYRPDEVTVEVKGSFYTPVRHVYDSRLRTEEVVCNLCGHAQHTEIGKESGFSIRKCGQCGLVYVNPQPVSEDLPKFYEGFYEGINPHEAAEARSAGYTERHVSRTALRLKPAGGRLLDVGCGYGRLLKAMQDYPGWELHGFDLNAAAVRYAREEVPGAAIETHTVEQACYPDNSFDCIVMIGVLEHLKDPRATLRRVRQWLAPGGVVLFQVPYVTPFIRMKHWLPFLPVNFEAPRHLFDFSPSVLRRLCESAGFRDPQVEISRPYTSNSRLGMMLIWMVKAPGLLLDRLGGGWTYPFACAWLTYASKPAHRD